MKTATLLLVALVGGLCGCSRSGTTTTTSASLFPGEQPGGREPTTTAAHDLASTFCNREEACGAVGPGHRYGARPDCVDEQRRLRTVDLEPGCSSGIDRTLLDACVAAAQKQACSPTADLSQIPQCRAATLCR